jgi:hypothetical protein
MVRKEKHKSEGNFTVLHSVHVIKIEKREKRSWAPPQVHAPQRGKASGAIPRRKLTVL